MTTKEFYSLEKPEFYDEQAQSANPLRKWFHQNRHRYIAELVADYYDEGKILDIACGNCVWNQELRLPVVGVDINEEMLKYAVEQGRLAKYLTIDLHQGLRDIKGSTASIIVMSEILEHLPNYRQIVQDAYYMLEPKGMLVTSVPYDTNLSLWKPLFKLQCLYMGLIKRDEYYKKNCGHINHFSPVTISQVLTGAGFKVIEQFDMRRFTIFTVGKKEV